MKPGRTIVWKVGRPCLFQRRLFISAVVAAARSGSRRPTFIGGFAAARGRKIIRERFAISRPPSCPRSALSRPDARIRPPALRAFRLAPKVHGREPVSVLPSALASLCFQLRARPFSRRRTFPPGPRRPSFRESMRTFAACSGPLWQGQSRRRGRCRDAARRPRQGLSSGSPRRGTATTSAILRASASISRGRRIHSILRNV